MGRTQKSQGLPPPAIRKDQRAKQARQFVNRTVPAILASNPRARKGAEGSELIVDPPPVTSTANYSQREKEFEDETKYIKRKGQGRRKAKGTTIIAEDDDKIVTRANHEKRQTQSSSGKSKKPKEPISPALTPPNVIASSLKIRILHTTTLTAAHSLLPLKPSSKHPNPCILNMASPLRPGGGVLSGATSQEETLCTSTSLLPSLNESFYRLPEYGGILTRDVLVLREEKTGRDLGVKERWWVDVISAGMLRFPDLVGEEGEGEGEGEEKRLGKKDRRIVERKIRAVLRIAAGRGVKKLVLGAWGCGAYGNPVRDVAEAFYTVLCSPSCSSEDMGGMDEIVFAIPSRKMAEGFAGFFDPEGKLEVEDGPGGGEEEEEEETDEVAEELRRKIEEMEGQIGRVWNEDLKVRMLTILEGLRGQLRERVGDDGGASDAGSDVKDDDEEEEGNSDGSEGGGCSISPPRSP